jgi:hypothetical protein
MQIAPDNPVIELRNQRNVLQATPQTAMNTNTIARLVIVFAAGLIAAAGAEAKGASMGVGLTIVPSCAVSSASAYRAASTDLNAVAGSTVTAAGCSFEATYTVSVSPAGKVANTQAQADSTVARGDTGDVVVTLTY